MIVYEADKTQFRADVRNNIIERKILELYKKNLGHGTSSREVESWKNSLVYMNNVLEDDKIPADAGVAIEFELPHSLKRMDFVISGKDENQNNSVVIVELKQWSEIEKTDMRGVVKTFIGGAVREKEHPSYQAWSYASFLQDFSEAVEQYKINLHPCAYLHNCIDKVVVDPFYNDCLEKAPAFLRDDVDKITNFIKKHIHYGDKNRLLYQIDHGEIKPSKKLADSIKSLLKGNKEFTLLDEQKVIYEKAFKLALASDKKTRNVFIVKGGPGTGKSVVAINLLVELIAKQLNVQYISKNSAPRLVYEEKLTGSMSKARYHSLFSGSGSFVEAPACTFDALVVDEAHRLNAKSGMFANLGENQIKEIIHASKFSVFFIDEDQRIAWNDIGSIDQIKKWAAHYNANVYEDELVSQFRCSGSDGYLGFLDYALQIKDVMNFDVDDMNYDFKVFDDPKEMYEAIKAKNKGKQTARLLSGYCWKWISKKNPDLFDIEIENLKVKWNLSSRGMAWINDPESINESGCIHTCQGLEVDYAGVIMGDDLKVRDGEVITDGFSRAQGDRSIAGFKGLHKKDKKTAEARADEIIKNTYKTLMTRGMKGCYLYCTDRETREYFKKMITKR